MRFLARALLSGCVLVWATGNAAAQPAPGDLWREYVWAGPYENANNWQRVTNPNTIHRSAQEFLPNPVNSIQIDDLEGAVRVEVCIERLQSHAGTWNKRIRVNGNDWISIPEVPGMTDPECYQSMIYPVVEIPLDQVVEGTNTFEFTTSGQFCHNINWGQWIVPGVTFRVYYEGEKPAVRGRIITPAAGSSFGIDPRIEVAVDDPARTERVDVVGRYLDWNYEGDLIWRQWHYTYRYGELQHHIGSATDAPFGVTWDTEWLPEQEQPVELAAWIRSTSGYCTMTPVVGDLAFERTEGYRVALYRAEEIPEKWQTREGQDHQCTVRIPSLDGATDARMYFCSWSGGHADGIGINDHEIVEYVGYPHLLSYDILDVPVEVLREGDNHPYTFSESHHHGIEVQLPGMPVKVKYRR